MKHFSCAIPGTPQSKCYVMLIYDTLRLNGMYRTYYDNGTSYASDFFPSHWLNGSSYHIKNYISFFHLMIKTTDPPLHQDYWYSIEICKTSIG